MMVTKCKLHYGRGLTVPPISDGRGRPPIDVAVCPELGRKFVEKMRAAAAEKEAAAAVETVDAAGIDVPLPSGKPRKGVVVTDEMLAEAMKRRFENFETIKSIAESMGVKTKTMENRMSRYMKRQGAK